MKQIREFKKLDLFVCDLFGIITSKKDIGFSTNLHSGAALMCNHFFYGILSVSEYSKKDFYFYVWTYPLGYVEWINQQLQSHGEKSIILLQNRDTDDEFMLSESTTISTTSRLNRKGYTGPHAAFENNEHKDFMNIYLNQSSGKAKKKRRKPINPNYTRMREALIKQEINHEDIEGSASRSRMRRKKDKTQKRIDPEEETEEEEDEKEEEGHEEDESEETEKKDKESKEEKESKEDKEEEEEDDDDDDDNDPDATTQKEVEQKHVEIKKKTPKPSLEESNAAVNKQKGVTFCLYVYEFVVLYVYAYANKF